MIIVKGMVIEFDYVNYRNEHSHRTVTVVLGFWYGMTKYRPEQMLLNAYDHEKKELRDFAVKDMRNVRDTIDKLHLNKRYIELC